MKLAISLFLAALPLLALANPEQADNFGGNGKFGQGQGNKGQQAQGQANQGQQAQQGQGNKGQQGGNNGAAAAAAAGDPQTSTTLLQSVIATGFAKNGQETPTAGQVASLTSTNNFINFCATTGKPLTNGQQIKTGSCNPAPMGVIAASTNMPSCKFVFPPNLDTSIQPNKAFTIKLAINHLQTGSFTNAQQTYYSAPQTVNAQGDIIGHSHVVIQKMTSLTQTDSLDPNVFAFFKGVNEAAVNGQLSVPLTAGLPEGFYRLSTINSAANHQPVLVAIAQHGDTDDTVYFTVGNPGGANKAGGAAAGGNKAGGAAAGGNKAAAGKGGKRSLKRRFARDHYE